MGSIGFKSHRRSQGETHKKLALSIFLIFLGHSPLASADHGGSTPHQDMGLSVPASSSTGNYTITWDSGATYHLQEKQVGVTGYSTIAQGGSSKSITGKANGTYSYRLRISLYDKWTGERIWWYSAPQSIVVDKGSPPGVPGAVGFYESSPVIDATGSGATFHVRWGNASGAVTRYVLRHRKNGGTWSSINLVPDTATSTLETRTAGTHGYRVKACNNTGCSAYTATKTIEVIYLPPPGVPGDITGPSSVPSADNSASYTLTWAKASGTVDDYELERRIANLKEDWQQILPTAPRTREEVNLPYGTYRYRVKACNTSGCSAYTDIKTVQVSYLALPGVPGPISGPSDAIDATGDGTSYTLNWADASGTVDTYIVERRSGTSGWPPPIQDSASQLLNESSMTAGTYEYRVAACNGSGCGPYTETKPVTVTYQPPAPGVPGAISAPPILYDSTGSGKDYSLSWGGASGTVTRYELKRRIDGGAWSQPLELETDLSTFFDEVGRAAGTYEYRVLACNGPSCSAPTDIATVEVVSAIADGPNGAYATSEVGTISYNLDVSTTGDAVASVPLQLIDGMAGFGPSLSLEYDSGRGIDRLERSLPEDTIGYGWRVAGLSRIRRCIVDQPSSASIQLNSGDSLCLNGMPLVLASGSHFGVGAVYRTLIESYVKVEIKGATGALWFEATLPDGTVQEYGRTDGSRVDRNGGTDYQWSLNKATDVDGNVITYTWYRDIAKGINYIASIDYAGARVEFDYSPRDEAVAVPIAGVLQEQSVLLQTIRVRINDRKVREYFLIDEEVDGLRRLNQIQQCGYSENGLIMSCLPPLDLFWVAPSSTVAGVPILVNAITDGLGANHSFEYGAIVDGTESFLFSERPFLEGALPPDTRLLAGSTARRFIATKLRRDNGFGGYHDTSYAYQGVGVESTRHWGFLGFFAQRITDEESSVVTYAQYRLDYPHFGQIARLLRLDSVYGSHTQTLARSEWGYAQQTINHSVQSSVYPYVNRAINFVYEGATQLGALKSEHALTFSNGLVSQMVSTVRAGTGLSIGTPPGSTWGDIAVYNFNVTLNTREKAASFTNRTTGGQWLINFPNAIVTESWPGAPGGNSIVQDVTMSPRPNSLRPSLITRFPNDLELTLTTAYAYDDDGHVTSMTVSGDHVNSRTSTVDFEPGDRYPRQTTNAEGHTTTFNQYDPRFGTIKQRGKPNERNSSWERDTFGRVSSHTNGDGVVTTTSFHGCGSCPAINGVVPAFYVVRDSAIIPVEKIYYDKLGRVLRTETQLLDGSFSKRDFKYDVQGRLKKASLPYFSGTAEAIVYSYDLRDRVTNVLRPDGSNTATRYSASGNNVIATVTEAVKKADGTSGGNQVKRNEFNILGQLVKTTDAYGSSDAVSTAYTYDANGNLLTATVNGGVDGTTTTTYEYDAAGNRTKVIDPDIGNVTLKYTALGQVRTRLDNKGQQTTFNYDLIGRLYTRNDPDGLNVWTWDTATNGIGKLASRAGPDGFIETYSYNDAGKLSTIVTEFLPIGGTNTMSYTTSHAYDGNGRPKTTTFPGGFVLTRVYNARGYLSELRNGTTAIQTFNATDPFGQSTHETYGNGVETYRSYDSETGRLTNIDTSIGSTVLQNNEYAWRSNGILESRTANPAAGLISTRMEVFTYDVLNRLKLAETYVDGSNTRDLSYQYSTLGNLESKTSTESDDIDVASYNYGSAGAAPGPHGVWTAVIDGVTNTLTYDNNGAVTRYDIAGTSEDKWLAYNVANQPTRIVIGSDLNDATPTVREDFRYDPNGRRYARETIWQEDGITRTQEVHYVGDVEIISFDRPGVITTEHIETIYKTRLGPNVMHVKAQGSRLIDGFPRSYTETHFEYAHRDHLGSIEVVTDDSGATLHRLSFDPFGMRKQDDWSGNITSADLDALRVKNWDRAPRARGFTGHEHLDRAGLIHMNGRVYDPLLGRFLSPDPLVQFPMFSQNWNRYSYIDNKPTSFTDPSGFMQSVQEGIDTITVVGTSTGQTYWFDVGLLPFDRFAGSGGGSAYVGSTNNASGVGETDPDAREGFSIKVSEDFWFTEEDARATLKRFWEEAGSIRRIDSDEFHAWLDKQISLTQDQMNAAFGLAIAMAYAGESTELVGKLHAARNPAKVIKILASEGVGTSELIENIQENWSDTLGSWNPLVRGATVSAGRLFMTRPDGPHNYLLFTGD